MIAQNWGLTRKPSCAILVYMSKNEDNGPEYASLRILAETNRKLKVLSGLKDKPILAVVEELVSREYITSLSLAAKGAKLDS